MKRLRRLGLIVGICGLPLAASAASAATPKAAPAASQPAFEVRIAAVVNDEVISGEDLASRLKMVLLSSNLPDRPEVRARLTSQVLRTLIDEKLQLQEAKRQHVTATDAELKRAIGQLEKQNNMQSGQLEAFLKARGIDPGALINQITAAIVWAKLVRQRAAETSPLSDDQIEQTLVRLKQNAGEPQSRVAEIFLPVDNPNQDEEVRQLALRLTQQMRQGARFSAIAQQFSHSATAAVGGDIGWVRPDELDPRLGKAIEGMRPGELSPPVRTRAGYYLLLVLDRRSGKSGDKGDKEKEDETWRLAQVVFPLPPQANAAARRAAIAAAESVRAAAPSGCDQLIKIGKARSSPMASEGNLRVSEIAPAMRKVLAALPVGRPSEPIVQKNGVGVVMVCEKETPHSTVPTREEVEELLIRQRLDTIARSYMRELRQAAYVDVRV
ncbi:MAG TPA: peptidylprolyl isomerase [Stellaceae bacterium]|nr:peptidylprolyl isomerase [Stellaceae bacterium]